MILANLQIPLQLQSAGRYADAARCYSEILISEPDNADALHLFGVLHHQSHYHERAIELIEQAIALRPGVAAYHANLAEAHRALGHDEQAIECCQAALRLQPQFPQAANNLGLALHNLERFDEAVEHFRAAIEMKPDFALAHNNLGTSLLRLDRIGPALSAYRAAVEHDPKCALAQSNLGQLLIDHGQAEEGLKHCEESVRLQPGVPAALNNLGNALRALERWNEAYEAYEEALAMTGPEAARSREQPQILANLGLALFLEGRRGDAFQCFRQAVDLVPEDVSILRYLANAHDANEDSAASQEWWRKIVKLAPQDADAHVALGSSLQDEGRSSDAAASYNRALELNPKHVSAILHQGSLSEVLGRMSDAEASYRKARALAPHAPHALARLSQLLRGKLPAADLNDIKALLRLPDAGHGANAAPTYGDARVAAALPPNSPARGPLLFGLAHVLDAQGEFTRAADCLVEANERAREARRREGKKYDSGKHSALVDRIIAGFTPELFRRLAGAGNDTRRPVFVFGMPRSGTTLVEQVLASHSRVHGAGELPLGAKTFHGVPSVVGLPDDMAACLAALNTDQVRQLGQDHLEGLDEILANAGLQSPETADRVVDKMPDNYLFIGLLALLFPRATFIHVRRDLRDVAVSCWMTQFAAIRWADDFDNLSARCRDFRRLMLHWQRVLPVAMHEVVYERLVDDFDHEAPRLLQACGLEWEPACGQFHQTTRPVRTASITQVRQPLYRKAVARWKHYETPLADLFAQLPQEDA